MKVKSYSKGIDVLEFTTRSIENCGMRRLESRWCAKEFNGQVMQESHEIGIADGADQFRKTNKVKPSKINGLSISTLYHRKRIFAGNQLALVAL